MSRKIILIKQELLLLVYELNRSGLLAENEKIRPILAQLEKLLLCDLSDRKSGSAGMPRPISYAVFCLKKKKKIEQMASEHPTLRQQRRLHTPERRAGRVCRWNPPPCAYGFRHEDPHAG